MRSVGSDGLHVRGSRRSSSNPVAASGGLPLRAQCRLMADGSAPPPPPKWYHRPPSVVFLLVFVLRPVGLPVLGKSPAFVRGVKLPLAVVAVAHSARLVQPT